MISLDPCSKSRIQITSRFQRTQSSDVGRRFGCSDTFDESTEHSCITDVSPFY